MPAVHDGGKPPCYYDSFLYNKGVTVFVSMALLFLYTSGFILCVSG
jgi:hypothetical protein